MVGRQSSFHTVLWSATVKNGVNKTRTEKGEKVIHVYLNDEIQKVQGFKTQTIKNRDGREWEEYSLPGINLYREKGRFYINLDLGDRIPSPLADLVGDISLQDTFPKSPKRTSGIYNYKDAKAVLEDLGPNNTTNRVQIRGKIIDSVTELYGKIRAGTILPPKAGKKIKPIPGPHGQKFSNSSDNRRTIT